MTTTVWTAVVALSTLAFAGTPASAPRPITPPTACPTCGGPPDTLVANPRASVIRWQGTGFGGRGTRTGTVALTSGMVVLRHEQLTSGSFTIDMQSLDGALRTPDFLDAAGYPTAVFIATGATRVGQARWQVSGNLTMRGVTKPVSFDTDVRWEELGHLVATASLTLDRREWGIGNHASGIADVVVDNAIRLTVSLDARRKQAAVAAR
jgi:polyisoprenoid-binding protein YceI